MSLKIVPSVALPRTPFRVPSWVVSTKRELPPYLLKSRVLSPLGPPSIEPSKPAWMNWKSLEPEPPVIASMPVKSTVEALGDGDGVGVGVCVKLSRGELMCP